VADSTQHDHPATISLAVWDVPMPVVAGERFSIKAGAKSAAGRVLTGGTLEVSDGTGAVVATATLGKTRWPGTEALYWAELAVPAPADRQVAEYAVRFVLGQEREAMPSRFSITIAAKPECKLNVKVTERASGAALDGVEIRIGPFHARTDKAGHAQLRVCKGEYQLQLWRTAHIAQSQPIKIDADTSVELVMVHVPEEHPDARWVR
jgi:hypothetical protein